MAHEDIYVLYRKPEHPLDPSGLDGWLIVKTITRKSGKRDSANRPVLIHEHHVMKESL